MIAPAFTVRNADDATPLPATNTFHRSQLLTATFQKDIHQRLTRPELPASQDEIKGPLPLIPGFQLARSNARGGMGEIFWGQDALGQQFAIKMIRFDRLSDPLRQRFEFEARTMVQLQHPRLARLYSYHVLPESQQPYFVMPRYACSLRQYLHYSQPRLKQAVQMLLDIAEGMAFLHQQGRIHRDLKPGNILLDAEGRCHISDFGLIKEILAENDQHEDGSSTPLASHSRIGMILGTQGYMGSEQASGKAEKAGPHWDVYAMGIIFAEILVRDFSCNVDPVLTREKLSGVPRGLQNILLKCVSDQPYRNASEVLQALKRWQRRWLYRAAVITGCLVIATTLGLSVAAAMPPKDPHADVYKKLARGEAVTLVGETGLPVYPHQSLIQGNLALSDKTPDGVLSVGNKELGLLQLLPGTQDLECHIQAEILTPTGSVGRAGLYIGHRSTRLNDGTLHAYAALWFSKPLPNKKARWTVVTDYYLCGNDNYFTSYKIESDYGFTPTDNNQWHRIEAFNYKDKPVFKFDGWDTACVQWYSDHHYKMVLQKRFSDQLSAESAHLSPHGGIGLLVMNQTAWVRNVVIRPVQP